MKLYLVRHGETHWNRQNRIQGWVQVGLTDRGRAQIRALAEHFPAEQPFSMAVSTLRRARESASILMEFLNVQQRWEIEHFRELNQGYWNGLRPEVLQSLDARRYHRWKAHPFEAHPPHGESLYQVRHRVQLGLQFLHAHTQNPVILVAHKVVNSLVAHLAGEWSFKDVMTSLPSNAAVYEVHLDQRFSTRNPSTTKE